MNVMMNDVQHSIFIFSIEEALGIQTVKGKMKYQVQVARISTNYRINI